MDTVGNFLLARRPRRSGSLSLGSPPGSPVAPSGHMPAWLSPSSPGARSCRGRTYRPGCWILPTAWGGLQNGPGTPRDEALPAWL